jgi:hypothetical protein
LRDIVEVLADADPEDKAEAYAELGSASRTTPTAESPSKHSRVG